MTALVRDRLNIGLLGLGLVTGLGPWLAGQPQLAGPVWAAGVVPVLAAL